MRPILFVLGVIICLTAGAQNIGIGETSPANKLSVKGNFSIGAGYSETAAPSNGAIIQGNVGIGTAAPGQALTVVDAGNTNKYYGTFAVFANNLTQGVGIGYQGIQALGSNTNQDLAINARGTGNVYFQVSGTTGNVGIGTVSPAATLEVNGSTRFDNLAGTGTRIVYSDASGNLIVPTSGNNKTIFTYSASGNQTFTVPTGITRFYVKLWGAGGGGETPNGGFGGAGGFISGILTVPSGTTSLTIIVGQGGVANGGNTSTYGGGGGGSTANTDASGSGGGRSAIQLSGADVVTAGGGGGGTEANYGYSGGAGGGYIGLTGGGSGVLSCGTGGTQSAGGTSGLGGTGTQHSGGQGANTSNAGGGGGGWWGGGGGGNGSGNNGGGGGGSSGANSTYFQLISTQSGQMNQVNAQLFTYLMPGGKDDPDYVAGVGTGGANPTYSSSASDVSYNTGGNGMIVISW